MRQWKHFPVDAKRPDKPRYDLPYERGILEGVVAGQVGSLLGKYGEICRVTVNLNGTAPVTKTYEKLALPVGIPLEDNSVLYIAQPPITFNGSNHRPGLYSVEQFHGTVPTRSLSVFDASIDTFYRVRPEGESRLDADVLQELHEALVVIQDVYAQNLTPNPTPFTAREFPRPVIEQDFLDVIAHEFPTRLQ